MTEEQKEFVREHYGGSLSVAEIANAIGVNSQNITHYVKHVSYNTMTETFKHFKRVKTRDFFDPLEEPEMIEVESKIEYFKDKIVVTFQSIMNY